MTPRQELVHAVQTAANEASKGYFNKEEASNILDAVIEAVVRALEVDSTLNIRNFGTFQVRPQPARTVKGLSGDFIEIPAYKMITFKSAKNLKNRINGQATD